jgi:hypothetical protein
LRRGVVFGGVWSGVIRDSGLYVRGGPAARTELRSQATWIDPVLAQRCVEAGPAGDAILGRGVGERLIRL